MLMIFSGFFARCDVEPACNLYPAGLRHIRRNQDMLGIYSRQDIILF